MLEEKPVPTLVLNFLLAPGGLNASRVIIHYVMWTWVVSLQVLMRREKDFQTFQISWLWRKTTFQSKWPIQMKPPCSGSRSLKGLLPIRRLINTRFQAVTGRKTDLLGSSVAGYKWEPSMTWHSENPGLHTCQWAHTAMSTRNNKSWWPRSSSEKPFWAAVSVKWRYCLENNIPSRFCLLLLMLPDILLRMISILISKWCPSNTPNTSLIQPMNQGVVAAFKNYYLRIFA